MDDGDGLTNADGVLNIHEGDRREARVERETGRRKTRREEESVGTSVTNYWPSYQRVSQPNPRYPNESSDSIPSKASMQAWGNSLIP